MPEYEKKQSFEVYNVISVKDAMAIIKRLTSNNEINTQDAEDYFIEQGATVWGLVAPVHRLSDKVNEQKVKSSAKEIAKGTRAPGRS